MKLMYTATELALAETGAVMILFPSKLWVPVMTLMKDPDKPENIQVCRSDCLPSMRSLPIDTLILMAPEDPDWDSDGLAQAKAQLAGSLNPKLISVARDGTHEVDDDPRR